MFQSSPALSSGRYVLQLDHDSVGRSFNPRPPFRAGATTKPALTAFKIPVSILARPFERALRLLWSERGFALLVSILARPFERALPR